MPTDPLQAVASTASNAVDTLDRLGVLEAVKNKLVNNPDKAAAHLVEVLDAIDSVYQELRKQILDFSTLSFSDDAETGKSRVYLRNLKTDGLDSQIADAEAACKRIRNIYQKYLDAWFQHVLNTDEQDQLRELFDDISIMDNSLVGAMWGLSDTLRHASESILSTLDAAGSDKSKQLIRSIESPLDQALQKLSGKFVALKKLRSEFVVASNAL